MIPDINITDIQEVKSEYLDPNTELDQIFLVNKDEDLKAVADQLFYTDALVEELLEKGSIKMVVPDCHIPHLKDDYKKFAIQFCEIEGNFSTLAIPPASFIQEKK